MVQNLFNGIAKGIDVSKYQGTINWQKVKNSGVDFAMIREGYGVEAPSQKDPFFETNYKHAKCYGVGVGVYHYSYATSTQKAVQEANFCLKNIAGKQLEYPVAFDIEDSSLMCLSINLKTEICRAFCNAIENAGYYAMIYCNLDWYVNRLNGAELAKKYDIWLAQWCSRMPGARCGIWQYSNCGRISGIPGECDMNSAYMDYPRIMKTRGLNGFSKTSAKNVQTESTKNYFEYTVQDGDTLWELAEKFLGNGPNYRKIQSLNGIANDMIYVGQVLKIPKK